MSQEKNRYVAIYGHWTANLYGPDGSLKQSVSGQNKITSAGVSALALLLNNAASAAATNTWRYIGIGSDSTAEATSNTALGTELARHTCVVSYNTGAIVEVVGTFGPGVGTGSIVEYGLFNSNTAGDMFARDVEGAVTKGALDSLEVTHQVTFQPG